MHLVFQDDLHGKWEDCSCIGADRDYDGKSDVTGESESPSFRSNLNAFVLVLTVGLIACYFDFSSYLVDVNSDFLDTFIRVDVFIEFHLSCGQFLLKRSVFSEVLNFVFVEHFDGNQVEAQTVVLFLGSCEFNDDVSLFLNQVYFSQSRFINF